MKRFLIFAAMAPPLGFVVAFWVMLQIANWLAGSPNTFDVAPDHDAADDLSGRVDPRAVGRVVRPCAGKAQRLVPHRAHGAVRLRDQLPAAGSRRIWVGFAHGPEVLLFGLIGAVPSAVCSWLAAERHAT